MAKTNILDKRCYLCEKQVTKSGYLFSCIDSSCGCVFWDDVVKKEIKLVRKNYSHDKNVLLALREARVPYKSAVPYTESKRNHHFVYVIDFGGIRKTAAYVGMTGLHPYHRYLCHLLKIRAGKKRVSNEGKFMPFYEGPMPQIEAVEREKSLAAYLSKFYLSIYSS